MKNYNQLANAAKSNVVSNSTGSQLSNTVKDLDTHKGGTIGAIALGAITVAGYAIKVIAGLK